MTPQSELIAMTGHQVNFFLTPDDLAECECRMRKIAPLALIEYRSDATTPKTLRNSAVPEMGKSWLSIGVVRPEDLGAIRFDPVHAQGYSTMDVLRSPLVELSRCFFDGKQLRRGRLYFTSRFYDQEDTLISKDTAFVKWARSVLKAAVRGLRRDKELQSYIGSQAEELRRTEKCLFVV